MQPPRDDAAAVNVDDGGQIHEPVSHRDIGDVDAPHLIGPCDAESPEQIGHAELGGSTLAQAAAGIDGGDAHFAHQPAHTLWADRKAKKRQMVNHAYHALGGMLGVLEVYRPHDGQVLIALRLGLVVVDTLAQTEHFKLCCHTQLIGWGY